MVFSGWQRTSFSLVRRAARLKASPPQGLLVFSRARTEASDKEPAHPRFQFCRHGCGPAPAGPPRRGDGGHFSARRKISIRREPKSPGTERPLRTGSRPKASEHSASDFAAPPRPVVDLERSPDRRVVARPRPPPRARSSPRRMLRRRGVQIRGAKSRSVAWRPPGLRFGVAPDRVGRTLGPLSGCAAAREGLAAGCIAQKGELATEATESPHHRQLGDGPVVANVSCGAGGRGSGRSKTMRCGTPSS